MKPIDSQLADERIASLAGWSRHAGHAGHAGHADHGDRIRKTFQFSDFVSAFGWMSSVALIAEKLDHHPDWKNVYRTVEVELWTHEAGGLTERDFTLAEHMNRLAAPLA